MRIASDQVRGLTDKLKRVESDKWRSSPKSGRRAANVSIFEMHAVCSTIDIYNIIQTNSL